MYKSFVVYTLKFLSSVCYLSSNLVYNVAYSSKNQRTWTISLEEVLKGAVPFIKWTVSSILYQYETHDLMIFAFSSS